MREVDERFENVIWDGCSTVDTLTWLREAPLENCASSNGHLKGEVRRFFLLAQSFYWPQTKRSCNRQFLPKSPKVGQKSGQSVKNWPNKTPFASDLLWESTNSVIGAAVGIHQFLHPTYCGNPLWQFQHPTYCGNPPIPSSELLWESNYQQVDSHSSSDDRIGGFPQ